MNRIRIRTLVLAALPLMLCACAPSSTFRTPAANAEVKSTILVFSHADPLINTYLHHAYAYAVFPTIGKGGFIVAGAHGVGQVFRGGVMIGTASVTQLSVGFLGRGGGLSRDHLFHGSQDIKAIHERAVYLVRQSPGHRCDRGRFGQCRVWSRAVHFAG